MSNSIKDFSEKIKNAIPNFKDVYKMTIILPSKIEITRHDKGNIYDMVDDPLFGKGLSIQDTNFGGKRLFDAFIQAGNNTEGTYSHEAGMQGRKMIIIRR